MKKLSILFFSNFILNALCILSTSAQTITSFSPLSGTAGSAVTITGTNFNTTAGSNIVYFGPVRATVTAASATSLTVTVPVSAGYNSISVTNLGTNLTAYSAKPFNLEFPVTGEQSFSSGYELASGTEPYDVVAGDLDNDGKTDLVTINATGGTLSVYRNLTTTGINFSAKTDIAVGTDSRSVLLSDIDGDGKKDLVAASRTPGAISIFRNTSSSGNISFAPKVDIASTNAMSLAVGDLNQDGKPDLVSAGNGVSVFKNTSTAGNISFTTTSIGFPAASGVSIGDLSGDNIPDLLVLERSFGTPSIASVLKNISTTDIAFASKIDFTLYENANGAVIADLDGDGLMDMAITTAVLTVFRNTSSGGVISMANKIDLATTVLPYAVAASDLDGDGKPDLVSARSGSANGSLSLFKNVSTPGTLQFQAKVDYTTSTFTGSYGLALADLDSDGRPEVATVNSQGSNPNKVVLLRNISIIPPPAISSFTPATAIPGTTVTITGSNFNTVANSNKVTFGAVAAEVTAATSTSLSVKVPIGATYSPIEVLNTSLGLKATSAGRFSPSFTPVKLKSVQSDLESKVDYTANPLTTGMIVTDMDGDGKADVAISNQSPALLTVFRNNSAPGVFSSSSFDPLVNFTTAGAPVSIAAADLDNDGKSEMVTANGTGSNLSIFRNTSTSGSITSSSFAAKADITTGGNTTVVAVSDINLDGRADLLYLNSGIGTLYIAKNNSVPGTITSGSFSSAVSFATGNSPAAIATGDLNGDGKPEVVVANSTSNTISVYNNNSVRSGISTTSLAAKVDFITGTTPVSLTIGDLNGDGKPEIIVANRASRTVSIFRNVATSGAITSASFALKKDFGTVNEIQGISLADVNGDGKPDLLNANIGNGASLLQNDTSDPTNILFGGLVYYLTGLSPKVALGADLDGDFRPDIVAAIPNGLSINRNNPNNKPIASTGNPSAVTISGATLSGTANDNGETTSVSFEYGLLANLSDAQTVAATTGASIAAGTGNSVVAVTLTGLLPASNYFYRVKAQNASGTTTAIITREFSTLLNQTPLAVPSISYAASTKEYKTGTAITPLQPVNAGGEVPPGVYLQSSTLAGDSTSGYADGIDSFVRFDAPTNVVADGMGNLYISDQLNHRIRKLVIATKTVTTIAGSGAPAFADGTGTAASFNLPAGLALDGAGNLYVADLSNHRIRKIVLATGVVTTLAGSTFGFVNGTGNAAKFNSPWGIAYNGTGYLYVADQSNNAVRRIDIATQLVTTEVAGLSNPIAVTVEKGIIYILDQDSKTIRKFDLASRIMTILATSTQTQFNFPYDIVTDGAGNLYVADEQNNVIKKVSIATGTTTVLAGSSIEGFAEGIGTAAKFDSPDGLTYDRSALYVADNGNGRIRKISLSGYAITPTLPAGLLFDNKTGIISGSPTILSASKSYTITAYNAAGASTATIDLATVASTNTDLASLTLNQGILSPAFSAATSTYETVLSDTAKSINLKPLAADSAATVKINGQLITKGSTLTVPLITGVNTIKTVVTAQDTTFKKTYTVAVTVPAITEVQQIPVFSQVSGPITFGTAITITSAGADSILYTTNGADPLTAGVVYSAAVQVNAALTLKAVAKKSGKLNSAVATAIYTQAASNGLTALSISNNPEGFSFNPSQSDYAITFSSPLTSFTLSPAGDGTIAVNGVSINSGTASNPIVLVQGVEKSVVISISQAGKTPRTYTVKALLPFAQEMPVFSQASGPVAFGSAVSITSAGADSILYTLNGADPLTAGIKFTVPIPVNAVLTLKALAKRGGKLTSAVATASYTQAVSAGLTALTISNSPGSYTFDPNQLEYGLSFPNSASDFTVTAVGQGTITVDGVALSSGTVSSPIALVAGVEKSVKLVFTEAGKSPRIYTIKATRAEAGQLVTDSSGKVTLSGTDTQVLITSPTQPVTVIVPAGTAAPSIDYSAMIVGGTGIIPQTTVESSVANMAIPASVKVTSSSPSWNGVLAVPTITSYDLPPNTGEITTYGLTIEVGSPDVSLSFDKGIRLLLPGQAGKRAGFVHGGVFTEITRDGLTDSQAEADQLPANSAYKINVGLDLVIWTKAFSKFLTFTRTTDPDIALLAFDKDALTEELLKGQNTDLANISQSLAAPLPLMGPNGSSITWTSTDAALVSPTGVVKRPIFGSGSAAITLTATFKKGLVTDTRSYALTVLESPNSAPTMAAIGNTSICATSIPQLLNLTGISAGAEAGQQLVISISSDNPALFSNLTVGQPVNGTSALSYVLSAGTFGFATITVTLKDNGGTANGGTDTFVRSFSLQVNPLPVVQVIATPGNTISKGRTTVLSASGGTAYSWAAAAGIVSGQNTAILTVRPAVTTTYTVTVTNASGCAVTQSLTIDVRDDFQALDAMNIMTPNGDGVNDYLIIKNLDMYPNNILRVFDKAGRQIYTEQNYANKWAGTLNGSALAEGTYYYFLDFANGRGKVKGFVSIAH